jgi:hypothetical protein
MLALPYVSGVECIDVLARFGYRPRSRSGGLVSLQRDANVVIVPESATLGPALVGAILRTANIDPLDFLRALERRLLRAPTEPSPSSARGLHLVCGDAAR